MLTKLCYTLLLLVVMTLSGTEIWRVWRDPRLYIGKFDMAADNGDSDAKSKLFARKVGLAHAVIARELKDYNDRGAGGTSDTTYGIGDADQLFDFKDNLADLALTYQDVDIGKLLAGVRKSLRQPNEVSGAVTELDGQFRVAVNWPRAPTVEGVKSTSFLTDPRASDAGAARQVACAIIWAQIARGSAPEAKMGRSGFCQWVEALHDYAALVVKQTETGIDTVAQEKILQRRTQLAGLIASGFPGVYRLRADLTDLLPPAGRRDLLVQAQKDRLDYALLTDPGLKDLSESDRRLKAFALARPAIVMKGGELTATGDNWKSVLEPAKGQIADVARTVGAIRAEGEGYRASGFHIGSGLVITAKFALNGAKRPRGAELKSGGDIRVAGLSFCTADRALADCPPAENLPITEVVYVGDEDSNIAILRVRDDKQPGLLLRDTAAAPEALVDQYIYMLGYPGGPSQGVPSAFYDDLIGDEWGLKRLMPGRSVALGDVRDARPLKGAARITLDINSTAGTAGAPIIDLTTGRVIAVHLAGLWDEKKGKFAFAEIISPEVVAAIQNALAPPPETPPLPPIDKTAKRAI